MVDQIEQTARWLHDEGGFGDAWTTHTWPEHPGDTGQREGGFVKIVPSDVQALYRDCARRLLIGRRLVDVNPLSTPPLPDDAAGEVLTCFTFADQARERSITRPSPPLAPDVSELLFLIQYRVGNPSAWQSYDEEASELFRQAAAMITRLAAPRPVGEELVEVVAAMFDDLADQADTLPFPQVARSHRDSASFIRRHSREAITRAALRSLPSRDEVLDVDAIAQVIRVNRGKGAGAVAEMIVEAIRAMKGQS